MPISTTIPLLHVSQEEFGKVAYEVLCHSFKVHDSLGRNFDEAVYQSTLRSIFNGRAIEEVEICLVHQGFRKQLYFDLVVDFGCPFELKTVSALNDAHKAQLIQYLMLTGLSHGKLINFGNERVEHRFVNSHVTPEQRRTFEVLRVGWIDDESSRRIEEAVVPLVSDWGTGLSRSLYLEALVALVGGETVCRQFVATYWNGKQTGRQSGNLIAPGVAFEISCKKQDLKRCESHFRRFLVNTDLATFFWINITSGQLLLKRIECG